MKFLFLVLLVSLPSVAGHDCRNGETVFPASYLIGLVIAGASPTMKPW